MAGQGALTVAAALFRALFRVMRKGAPLGQAEAVVRLLRGPDALALGWVSSVVGCGDLVVVRGLRTGGSPWLLRAGERELVLRVGGLADGASFVTEAAALRLAAEAAIPVPPLLGHDAGRAAGVPLVLTERLPGSSEIPAEPDSSRLRAVGVVVARLHAVPLGPSAELLVLDGRGVPAAKLTASQPPS